MRISWAHREELASDVAAARARQDPEMSSVYMGQGAGQVEDIRPAAEVVREICEGAEGVIQEWARMYADSPLDR